jgi:hypothetical protein
MCGRRCGAATAPPIFFGQMVEVAMPVSENGLGDVWFDGFGLQFYF